MNRRATRSNEQYYPVNNTLFQPGVTNYTATRLTDLTNILSDTNNNLKDINESISHKPSQKNPAKYHRTKLHRSISGHNRSCDYSDNNSMKYYSKSSMSENEDDYSTDGQTNRHIRFHKSRRQRNNPLFADDMNETLHDHPRRDIPFHHYDTKQMKHPMMDRYSNPDPKIRDFESGIERQLENRLKSVYHKMKRQRDCSQNLNNIKLMQDEFSKPPRDDMYNLHQVIVEAEKNKAQNDLIQTKKRLADLEESKHGLANEVQHLKDQLNRFDSGSQYSVKNECLMNNPNRLEKEIEILKAELARTKPQEASTEVIKAIDKYEKQNDILADHNQALKVLLKEKEKHEQQYHNEIQILKEKNSSLELNNCKLQSEMDNLFVKYNDSNNELEKYMNFLRTSEDQFNNSEKKREELKLDAQETIKLWKTKVKKLEKNLERYKNESDKLGEQNNGLIGNFNNLTQQIDAKNQETSVLREINSNLEEKVKNFENELRFIKNSFDQVKEENENYKSEITEVKNNNKSFELKLNELQVERSHYERQKASEDNRMYDLNQKYHNLQNEFESSKVERKDLDSYISKLETDINQLRSLIDSLELSEQDAKEELSSLSKQAINNKESYDETITKYSNQLQQSQYQIQKLRLEHEDKLRQLQSQAVEDKSNLEYYKNAETDNLKEIEQLKSAKRRLEDDYFDLNDKLDQYIQSDSYKTRIIKEYDEKKTKLANELNLQKNEFFSKETEYLKMLNLLDVEADIINGMIASNTNESYRPIFGVEETNKSNNLYLLIKHKINWFGKNLEEMFQKQAKLQQSLKFLEIELENMRKSNDSNIQTQNYFLKNLESQNSELLSERAIALKNMELLQTYLHNLNESVKNQTLKEIEKSHHIHAIEHVQSMCNNNHLSDSEKNEINMRFKQYRKTIDDIKTHFDLNDKNHMKKEYPRFVSSSVSSFGTCDHRKVEKKSKKCRPAFKC